MRVLFVMLCAVALATMGFWLGWTVHGASVRALAATASGAAGGFGIGCAALHVLRLSQARRHAG